MLDRSRPTRRGRIHHPSGVFLSPHRGYRQATSVLVINEVLTPGATGHRPRARTGGASTGPPAPQDRPDAPLRRPRSARRARPRRDHRDAHDDVLHVRVPLRHPRAPARRRGPVHRRQSRSPAQRGRDLRQGFVGHHEAVLAGAADEAAGAQARRRPRRGGLRRDRRGTRRSRCSRSGCATIRSTDPKQFALFTGRDQMQALTGLFARQFGTPNYAAHGGFCSVNMAAGMIYTIGGSFWEFGGPDLERAKLFVMIGTAEDHHSNPLKIAISKFKRDGGRFISINPIRTGYSAIADEWLPIKPGTDGALLLALIHELIALGLYDREFLVRYTNAGQLVNVDEANDEFGMFVRTEVPKEEGCFDPQNKLWWDRATNRPVVTHTRGHRSVPAGRVPAVRRHRGQALVPAAQGPRRGLHAGVGGRHHRHPGRGDPAARPRDGHHRARPEDRAADRVDRHLGQGARHGHRQSGRVPRDARPRGALERLPHHPRAGDPDDAARHDRPAGRLPPQGAVPAPDPALRQDAEHAARRSSPTTPLDGTGARLAGRAGRPVRQRRRHAGAHRQGVLVGVPAGRARDDAQRHHQRAGAAIRTRSTR